MGRGVARGFGALVAAASVAAVLFFSVLLLTFFSWKAAVLAEVLAVGVAVMVWRRRSVPAWLRFAVVASLLLTAIATAAFLRTTWETHATHNARLSAMVSELCDVELPRGSAVKDCRGSISNTGNGNSCRYLATAIVLATTDPHVLASTLHGQGFSSTELDLWGDPVQDGRSYVVEGAEVRLFSQSSWQEDENDLRCT